MTALFSEYNGIQVFIYPYTLMYWITGGSLLVAITSLLSISIHYLPISFFGVILIYVAFISFKLYTMYFTKPHRLELHNVNDFWDSIIRLHLYLFITLMILMVFFVLSEFLSYFYGIKLPLKQAVMALFRIFTVSLILIYYLWSTWLKPYRNRNYGRKRAEKLCLGFIIHHPWESLRFSVITLLMVLVAVRAYALTALYVLSPIFDGLSRFLAIKFSLELSRIHNTGSILYDLFVVAAAFMLSNLCFYPFIILSQKLITAIHPIKLKSLANAKA